MNKAILIFATVLLAGCGRNSTESTSATSAPAYGQPGSTNTSDAQETINRVSPIDAVTNSPAATNEMSPNRPADGQ